MLQNFKNLKRMALHGHVLLNVLYKIDGGGE